jgi:hypothetical protein
MTTLVRITSFVALLCLGALFNAVLEIAKENVERATRLELATFSLGIKIFIPLFSTLTKSLEKNVRAWAACRACIA